MRAERGPDGQARITVDVEELRDGSFARNMRKAVQYVVEQQQGGPRPPEFGQAAPEGEGYELSSEVEEVVQRLVGREERFEHIADDNIKLGCALQVGKKPEGKGGLHLLARAVKAPTLWRDLGEWEVVVWANAMAWQHLTERQREALIAHELSHIGGRAESGTVFLLEHDIEEFAWVVRTYGQWHSGLEHFAEQLGLFQQSPDGGR